MACNVRNTKNLIPRLWYCLLCIVGVLASFTDGLNAEDLPHNIVFMFANDLGYGDLG